MYREEVKDKPSNFYFYFYFPINFIPVVELD